MTEQQRTQKREAVVNSRRAVHSSVPRLNNRTMSPSSSLSDRFGSIKKPTTSPKQAQQKPVFTVTLNGGASKKKLQQFNRKLK